MRPLSVPRSRSRSHTCMLTGVSNGYSDASGHISYFADMDSSQKEYDDCAFRIGMAHAHKCRRTFAEKRGKRMNRDFEIKQLLRAYRSGMMSEAAFDEEMTRLEHETAGTDQGSGFEAFGQHYRSEREALLNFFDELHATQIDAALAFAKWAAVCRTPGLRTGLIMIAERDAGHARILARRAHELGGELHSVATEHGSKLVEILANPEVTDLEKLTVLAGLIREPKEAVAPILAFASMLKADVESQQALRLLADDELSTATWLHDIGVIVGAQPLPNREKQQPTG